MLSLLPSILYKRTTLEIASALLLMSTSSLSLAADADMLDLGVLPGGGWSVASGVNAAGDVVVGYSGSAQGTRAFRWTQAGGMVDLGALSGEALSYSYALGVNATGDVMGGYGGTASYHAFRWTQAGGMADLGVLPGGAFSDARGVNAVGNVVVGQSGSAQGQHAFRWTQTGGMADLGVLPGGSYSSAYGVDATGNVVVGHSFSAQGQRAFRWTQAGGMVDLGVLSGGSYSSAYSVNVDGNVVVGVSTSTQGERAFRWTRAGGMTDLGVLRGGTFSSASGVNAAGDAVVGRGDSTTGQRAFRWTQASGMQSVEQWLADHGVVVSGANTKAAYGMNAAGNVVVGQLVNDHAFIARASNADIGLIYATDFNRTPQASACPYTATLNSDADWILGGLQVGPTREFLLPTRVKAWDCGDCVRHGSWQQQYPVHLNVRKRDCSINLSGH